ncbi:hypothetical protein RIF29_32858 [Crotalaria pallida]|uniref:Uncharacterized protein n=1 Tax=Crotalaria pallida TaxID=3830 RepID=A0AAN9ENT9_CROPI
MIVVWDFAVRISLLISLLLNWKDVTALAVEVVDQMIRYVVPCLECVGITIPTIEVRVALLLICRHDPAYPIENLNNNVFVKETSAACDFVSEDYFICSSIELDSISSIGEGFLSDTDFRTTFELNTVRNNEDDRYRINSKLEEYMESSSIGLDRLNSNKFDRLWEHQYLINELKMELKKVKATGEWEGHNSMKTPLPYIIIFGMPTPFVILAIIFANGFIKVDIKSRVKPAQNIRSAIRIH